MLNLGCFGKEKKKERKRGTRGSGGQKGLLPILSPLSRQRKFVTTGFPGPCVATGFSVMRLGSQARRTTRPVCTQ